MVEDAYRVATVEDLATEDSRVIAEVDGQEIAVFRHGGEYHALANYCVHQAGPLCEGALSKRLDVGDDGWTWEYEANASKNIVCPWHGWTFDISTGENVDDPRYSVPTYDVTVEDGDIYVIP